MTPPPPLPREPRAPRRPAPELFVAAVCIGAALVLIVGLVAASWVRASTAAWYAPAARALTTSFDVFQVVAPYEPLPREAMPFTSTDLVDHACYRVRPRRADQGGFVATVCFYTFVEPPEVLPVTVAGHTEGSDLFPALYPSQCAPEGGCWGVSRGGDAPMRGARRLATVYGDGASRAQRALLLAVVAPHVPDLGEP